MCHNGTKAFALAKCVQCHKVNDMVFKVKETGPVVFSHVRHLKGMQCNSFTASCTRSASTPR